jgi:hypothetical protein
MSFKELVGKKISKKVKFMEADVEIVKLTKGQVTEMQAMIKKQESEEDAEENLNVLVNIIRMGAPESRELTEEEFEEFPLDELAKLSKNIMEYSGMAADVEK